MASRVVVRQLGVVWLSNYSLTRSLHSHRQVLPHCGRNICSTSRLQYCTAVSQANSVDIGYENGLPVLSIPLPSRKEKCRFTLKPVTNTLGDFLRYIQEEDQGVDRVAAYNSEGLRIARSTTVDVLLQNDFDLVLNDQRFRCEPPHKHLLTSEHTGDIGDVKNTIAQLYSTLNVEQHQIDRELALLEKLENLKMQIQPMEEIRTELEERAEKRTIALKWLGLGMMGLQFGILARLTWWEYSWDIMEPVTYFVTYGTGIAMAAYYVCTKQDYAFPAVRDREYLLTIHRLAKKRQLDVNHYNALRDAINQTEHDLRRLRDPLQLQLPIEHLTKLPAESESQ